MKLVSIFISYCLLLSAWMVYADRTGKVAWSILGNSGRRYVSGFNHK